MGLRDMWFSTDATASKKRVVQVMAHQEKIKRSKNHVSVVLIGPTGSGKTSTIRHLIGHNNDIDFDKYNLKTSNKASETRETIEYVLRIDDKRDNCLKNITLSVIDTPGFEDTDGLGQDARNISCIKRFFAEEGENLPNLVMFVMRADGTRDFGPSSQFARCLKQYVDKAMGLTDGTNMVIVLTRAMSLERDEKLWATAAAAKMKEVENFTKTLTGWTIPVVLLDNNPHGMKKVSDLTRFPDKKTLQPKNLFLVISNVFDRNDDICGKTVMQEYFSREKKDSTVMMQQGRSIKASLDMGPNRQQFTPEEQRIFSELNGSTALPPQESMSSRDRMNTWRTSHGGKSDEEEDDHVKEAVEEDFQDDVQSAVSSNSRVSAARWDSNSHLDEIVKHNDYYVGKGYDVRKGIFKEASVFQVDMLKNHVRRLHITHTDMEKSGDRSKANKNASVGIEALGAAMASLNYNSHGNQEQISDSKMKRITLAKVASAYSFDFRVAANVNDSFLAAIEVLPDSYKKDKPKNRKKFEKFFSEYGQGFARTAYLGGEARHETIKSDVTADNAKELMLNASQLTLVKGNLGGGADMEKTMTTVKYRGGATHAQGNMDEWKKTLSISPHAFLMDVEEDVKLYHDFLLVLDNKRYEKIANALEDAYDDMYTDTRKVVVENQKEKDKSLARRLFGWFV